jgi:hypothetical protein
MDILHTFEVYQKQLDNLRKNNHFGRPQVLMQFRMQFKGFSENDISTLISFLTDNDKKWFVAHLLDNLDTFPIGLLEPMLIAAVDEPDPSFNNDFIKPCRRVFGYLDIQKILLNIFQNGDTSKKVGVLKALYWAQPTVYSLTVHTRDNIFVEQGYDAFIWDDDLKSFSYDFNFVEDKSVFEREHPKQHIAYTQQLKTILSEFYNTSDFELKYHIALRLPNDITEYPGELQKEAKKFLLDKNKQGIPENISEFDKVPNIGNSLLRKLFLKIKRLFTKNKGITLKQR